MKQAIITENEWMKELMALPKIKPGARGYDFTPEQDKAILERQTNNIDWDAFVLWYRKRYNNTAGETTLRRRYKQLAGAA